MLIWKKTYPLPKGVKKDKTFCYRYVRTYLIFFKLWTTHSIWNDWSDCQYAPYKRCPKHRSAITRRELYTTKWINKLFNLE